MRRFGSFLLLISLCFLPAIWVNAQEQLPLKPEITSPTDGDAIRGSAVVVGSTNVIGLLSWELAFGYTGDTTGSWFLIAEGENIIQDDVLTGWDTTTITDGDYNLRLTVYLEGERRTHFTTSGIRVRNYTAIEAATPIPGLTATPGTQTPQPTSTALPDINQTMLPDTPTPLPTNPVAISQGEISNSFIRGALGTLTIFLILGLYLTVKKTFH